MDTVPSLQYYSDSNLIPPATSPTHSQHSTKKRRASNSTSARGVANLNPEQLAKKRANDREAQRAIRERTKTQIETLERRIQELTTQQPYQELRLAIQQKEQVEAENEEIKRRLNSFINGIQPLIGGNGQVGRESYAAHWGNPSLTDLAAEPIPPCHATVGLPHALNSIVNHVGQPIGPQAAVYPDARSLPSTLSISRYPASRGQRNTTPSTSQSAHTGSPDTFSAVNVLERRVPSVSHALPNRTYEEKLEAAYLQNLHDARNGRQQYGRERAPSLQSTLPMNPLSPIQNPRDSFGNQLLACSVPVRNIPPACPLDGLLLDFLAERRQKAIEGVPSKELVGPDYPSVVTLLDPKRSPCSHPLSKVFTDMLVTFPDLSTLPEQVAVL